MDPALEVDVPARRRQLELHPLVDSRRQRWVPVLRQPGADQDPRLPPPSRALAAALFQARVRPWHPRRRGCVARRGSCATLPRVSEDPASPASAPSDDDRLRIVYELACERDEDAFARAREIAFEQTVELPEACVPAALQRAIVARLEGMERLDKRRWRATLSYAAEIVGGEVPQLLNVLFGNVSLFEGVRVVDVGWPRSLLAALPGPAFGIEGIRRLLPQADGRALLCTALKPIGLTSRELATPAGG